MPETYIPLCLDRNNDAVYILMILKYTCLNFLKIEIFKKHKTKKINEF